VIGNKIVIAKCFVHCPERDYCTEVTSFKQNQFLLKDLGYTIEEVTFDGVPATGGSFRCASMVLSRDPYS
jgi:hypothetical protein